MSKLIPMACLALPDRGDTQAPSPAAATGPASPSPFFLPPTWSTRASLMQ